VPPHSSQTNGNPVAPMSRPAATASAAIRAADEEGTRVIEDSRRAQAAVTHRPEGRSRVITKTRARSRACARGAFDDSPGGASAASAIMNASIASPGIERAIPSAMGATGTTFVSVTWAGASGPGLPQLAARTTRCFRAARARRRQHCHAHRC
jgi:hypothetical protein